MVERTDAPSGGMHEKVAVVASRRRLLFGVALTIGVLAAVVTWVAPDVLPSNAVFGAAVGLAALLIGLAATLAADAADLVVRGRRHVHAAGADVAAVIGRDPEDVAGLLAVVAGTSRQGRVRVGVVAASRSAGAPAARATALGRALANAGKRVLLTDMTRGTSSAPGLSEVVAGTHRLRDVVRFEQDVYLGHVAIGTDPMLAMDGYADWVERLPSDLEVLVAAFPPISDPGALAAVRSLDVVLLQVEVDRTERVDLLASLDALDAAGVATEVILVDPSIGRDPTQDVETADDETDGTVEPAEPAESGVEAKSDVATAPDAAPEPAVEGDAQDVTPAPEPAVEDEDEDELDLQPPAFVTDPDPAAGDDSDDADDTVDDPSMDGQPGMVGAVDLPAADATVDIMSGHATVATPDVDVWRGPEVDATPDEDPPGEELPDVWGEPEVDARAGDALLVEEEPVGEPVTDTSVDRSGGRWLDPRAVWSDLPDASASDPTPDPAPAVAEEPPTAAPPTPDDTPASTEEVPVPATPSDDPQDPIERDALTEEAVRATAALQALAFKVWERDEQS